MTPKDAALLVKGDTLYTVERTGSVMPRRAVFTSKVIDIDVDAGRVLLSWNGNAAKWVGFDRLKGHKISHPTPIRQSAAFQSAERYERECARCANYADAEKAMWRERRKAARASDP